MTHLKASLGKWLATEEIDFKGVTKKWKVLNHDDMRLGTVKWYAPWRQYCFFAAAGIVLNPTCLYDIGGFCEEETKTHLLKGAKPQNRRISSGSPSGSPQ